MEKNIQDERLDDYVKGSFEDYAENPATDMWERIEMQLPEVKRKPVWYAWRHFGWPMVAVLVILILMARLVCVEGYYEEKLQKISAQQDQAAQNTLQAPSATPGLPINDSNGKSKAGSDLDNTSATVQSTDTKTKITAQKQQHAQTQTPKIAKPGESKVDATGKQALQAPASPKLLNNSATQDLPAAKTADPPLLSAAQQVENQIPSVPALQADSIAAIVLKIEKYLDFQALAQKSPLLSFANLETPNTVAVPTKKFKESSGWYMGLFVTPHYTVEKTRQAVRPGPMNPRRLFTSQQERPQVSSDISLRVGKKINSRFAIETGLGYQHLNRTATHLARFEYREGQAIQNPSGVESRSFDYDLNTYSGSASVTLRMEVSGSDAPAALERVGALITSRESLQILQVPVLGVARLGQGRMKAVLKAGVLGSYLIKNSFEITANRLENNKLRFRGQDGYAVQFNRPQHFIWGYQLSAGAEFRLTKNLSFSAAPTLSGDFQRNDPQQGRLPGQMAVGVNLGVGWWF